MTDPVTYGMTDNAILEELGRRFRALRLRKNITQEELARRTMIPVGRIKALEAGRGKLETVIGVLRELGALEDLNTLLPGPGISPLQVAKMKGVSRQRASGPPRGSKDEPADW